MDRVREWAALIGRRNIAYVVFVSLLVPFSIFMEARPRCRRRDHGRDNLVGRGVADLLHSQCRVGARRYRQRPVGNEAVDCVRPADPVYCPSVAPGAFLRALTVFCRLQIRYNFLLIAKYLLLIREFEIFALIRESRCRLLFGSMSREIRLRLHPGLENASGTVE